MKFVFFFYIEYTFGIKFLLNITECNDVNIYLP